MSNFINYCLSVEKGLFGNIGKMAVSYRQNGKAYMHVMLFLSSTSDEEHTSPEKKYPPQIINVHFPEEVFSELKKFGVGDLVRVRFTAVDFSRSVVDGKVSDSLSIRVKGKSIEMLRPASEKRKANTVVSQTPRPVAAFFPANDVPCYTY